MLERLIKRDGSIQERDDTKLNGWGEWASNHLGERIDWSTAAIAATKELPAQATTRELMMSLIDNLLQINSYPAHLMAGRLYANVIRKDIYGSDVLPTVFAQQSKLISLGMMVDMGYTMAEYAEIEGMINHELDYFCPEFALKQIVEKYAIRNYITNQVFETPQFVYMRMAMELASKEPQHEKLLRVRQFYTKFSRKQLSAPTPNYLYLGTKHRGFASCCIYTSADDVQSLAIGNHIAFLMTANSAGLGSFINTRTVGDPIDGGRVKHGGKYRYLKATSENTIANKQAARAGAGTTSIMCFDPEVIDVLQYRNPMLPENKQNRDLHYSLLFNRFFARKAARNEDVFVFTQHSCPELFEEFFLGRPDKFAELYNKYEQDVTFPKTYISARRVIKFMFAEAFNTGTSYNSNIDEMAMHTPFNIAPGHVIHCANLCVAPETEILTDKGYLVIGEHAGEFVNVWNGSEFSKTMIVKTGENQKLLLVTTSNGMTLECTEYHKWYVVDDYRSTPREVRTHELKAGDKLIKTNYPIIEGEFELDNAYDCGFFTGDGTMSGNAKIIYLYGDKINLIPHFTAVANWNIEENNNRAVGRVILNKDKFFVPNSAYSVASRLKWLAGYLDADGTVCRNGNSESIQAKSTNLQFLKELQLMLTTIGISSKIKKCLEQGVYKLPKNDGSSDYADYQCMEAYRLTIPVIETQKLLDLGFEPKRLVISKREVQRDAAQFVKIESVVDLGRVSDTYCFNEPKKHLGVFNGLLTGQCQEICEIQSPYFNMMDLYSSEDHGNGEIAMCNLAAIPVDNVSDDEYEEATYLALKMVDHTILNGKYPFPHLEFTAKQRMNAGVGMMGVATHMARLGLKWDSIEGKREIHRISERHMYWLIRASLRIAKERGNAPWIHKTKWPKGWLPIDTYNKNVDSIGDFGYAFDWEQLRQEIIEQGGIAHSVLNAGMPGESSSKALGSTNAFYPVRSRTLTKTDGAGIVLRWAAVDEDLLTDNYQSAYDIPTKDLIDCYALFQKFADQSLSCDFYKRYDAHDISVSDDEIFETFFYQVKMGLKNRYYTNNLRPKKNAKKVDSLTGGVSAVASIGVPPVTDKSPVVGVDGVIAVDHAPESLTHDAQAYSGPAPILDLGILGAATGIAATPEMAERAVEMEEVENDGKCEGFCSL